MSVFLPPALLQAARALASGGKPALLALDGRCGSGKTTLAAALAAALPCQVVHTDDFYLPFARRAPNWQITPAANMDFDRLAEEILRPLANGQPAQYRPYRCHEDRYDPPQPLTPALLTVVEGSYALHPRLTALGLYSYRVFLTCTPATQRQRLQAREGAHYADFETRWIPLEEAYIAACRPEVGCELVVRSGEKEKREE